MERITRDAAKTVVQKALKEVANFSGDFEHFSFTNFHEFHKKVFLRALKFNVNILPCHDDLGAVMNNEYFDIDLTESMVDNWNTMSDCIDYVVEEYFRVFGQRKKIDLS